MQLADNVAGNGATDQSTAKSIGFICLALNLNIPFWILFFQKNTARQNLKMESQG